MHGLQYALLDLLVRPTNSLTMLLHNCQFALYLLIAKHWNVWDVPGIGVASNQSRRLVFPRATNEDGRMRLLKGLGGIKRSVELIILATVGRFVASPHLKSNLQRFL